MGNRRLVFDHELVEECLRFGAVLRIVDLLQRPLGSSIVPDLGYLIQPIPEPGIPALCIAAAILSLRRNQGHQLLANSS